MTVLVFSLQVATPLRAATVLWNPVGSTTTGGDWDTTSANWGTGGSSLWINGNNDTAQFGGASNGPPGSVSIAEAVIVGGLFIEAQTGAAIDFSLIAGGFSPESNTLNFAGASPTVKLKGSSTLDLDHVVRVHALLTGTQGLTVEFEDTVLVTPGANYGVLKLGQANFNYASTLSGGITVKNKAGLAVDVSPTDLAGGKSPLGANSITLEAGSKLEISGDKTSNGLSGRVFDTNGTGNTSRVDFTGTAVALRADQQLNNLNINPTPAINNVISTAIQWLGKVEIGSAGAYTFFASADDGARIFIDGQLVMNNDGGKGNTDLSSAPIFLSKGLHDLRVDYVQGSGGANINLGYAGPDTGGGSNGQARTVIPFSKLYQADVNELAGGSTALQLGNALNVQGNALVDLRNDKFSSVQMGRLNLYNNATLTVKSTEFLGEQVVGNGAGFGKTLRFGGTTPDPTIFGTPSSSGAQTVTIAADVNVAFDGVVSDEGRAMTIQKTGSGWLYFNQTGSANILGSTSSIQLIGASSTHVTSFDSYDSGLYRSTLTTTSTTGLLGMTVSGAGIPAGAVVIEIMNGTTFKISGNASALQSSTSLTFSKSPTLVLTSQPGGNNPIGSAGVVLAGGNLVLDSKGATAAGMGPVFNNQITVNENAVIQSVANASTLTLGGSIGIAANKTLVLDAIAGGRPASDPGATLIVSGGITGDATTTLVIRSTQKNAGTTLNAAAALAEGVAQQTGFASQSGMVTLGGNNSGFNGTLNFEPGANLRVEGVNALSGKNFVMAGGTLQLLDDADGTGGTQNLAFNHAITITGNATLAVGRTATTWAPFFLQASNKRAQITSLNIGRQTLTLANNNGYGLQVTGATTLNGTPTFTVNNATGSNLLPGLHLAGQITGTASILKNGGGTLMLSDATNSFGGPVSFSAFGATSTLTVESVNNLVTGQRLQASAGISAQTSVTAINVQNFAGRAANGVTVITLATASAFAVGMPVSGVGISAGTTITAFNDSVTTTTSGFNGSSVVTVTGGAAGFRVGDPVFGSGIPNGTLVVSINGNDLTLSQIIGQNNPTLERRQVTLSQVTTTSDPTLVRSQLSLNQNVASAGTQTVNANSAVSVAAGVLAFTSDGALGDSTNEIVVSTNSATAGLRADGTFSIPNTRTIVFSQANNSLEITAGNTLTVNGAFTFPNPNNNLQKNNLGTLLLAQSQVNWNGNLTVGQGVVRIDNDAALGNAGSFNLSSGIATGATLVANVAAALELVGGRTLSEALVFTPGNNNTSNGISGGGALRSVSGNNIWNGTIAMSGASGADNQMRAATIGVDLGSTLTINGVITARIGTGGVGRGAWYGLVGAGDGIINSAMSYTGDLSFGIYSLVKAGTGTWTLTAANAFSGQNVYANQGRLVLSGAGALGVPGTNGGTGAVLVTPGGVLTLDNSGTNISDRLGARALTLQGGFLNILGKASATTSETTGALALNAGHSIFTLTPGTGGQVTLTTGAVTRASGSTVLFRGNGLGTANAERADIQATGAGFVFVGQAGAVGVANKGILPYALIDSSSTGLGTSFATADAVTGTLRALGATEMVTNLTNNLGNLATPLNVSLSSTAGVANPLTGNTMVINSLTLNSGGGISNASAQSLILDSGGVLAFTGNSGISGGRLSTSSNRQFIFHALGDLSVSSALHGSSGGLAKSGAGVMTFSSQQFYSGLTSVNQGTLKLNGGTNTLFFNNDFALQGGSLDLNGSAQVLNVLRTDSAVAQNANFTPGVGGNVINSSATQATLGLVNAGGNFSGTINGNLALVRSTNAGSYNDWNIYTANTYSGPTLLNGGRTQLLGNATLGSTSSIEISQATLRLSNNNALSILDQQVDNRVNDAAPILMRGGMLQYFARNGFEATEAFGALTLAQGNSIIEVAEPGTGINSSTATFASLDRQAGSRGTLRFFGVDGAHGSLARVFASSLNGVATTNVGDGVTNHLIGGWAVFEREFASYTPGTGVGALNGVGYAGYSPNELNDGIATDNIRLTLPNVTSTGAVGTNELTIASTTGLAIGDAVLGNGIPAGARVASIIDGTKFTIDTTLGSANPTLNLPQVVSLTGNRTINSLALLVSGDRTLDLGSFTLNLASGGLIVSQGFSLTNAQVTVVTSSTTSNIIELASLPQNFVVGSTVLGRTVTGVNGLTVTLDGNANTNSTTPTGRDYVSGLYMPMAIQNGNITAGGAPDTAADLYLHALGYVNGSANVYNRDVFVGANIVDNGTGAVTLVINGTEGRSSFAGISDFRTNELVLSGNNTYSGGTFVNAGFVVLKSAAQAFGTGNVTITGGGSSNGNTFLERSSTVVFGASNQIANTATVTLLGGSSLELNGFSQTLGGLVFDNTGGNTPTLHVGTGVLTLNGNVTANSSNLGSTSIITTGVVTPAL